MGALILDLKETGPITCTTSGVFGSHDHSRQPFRRRVDPTSRVGVPEVGQPNRREHLDSVHFSSGGTCFDRQVRRRRRRISGGLMVYGSVEVWVHPVSLVTASPVQRRGYPELSTKDFSVLDTSDETTDRKPSARVSWGRRIQEQTQRGGRTNSNSPVSTKDRVQSSPPESVRVFVSDRNLPSSTGQVYRKFVRLKGPPRSTKGRYLTINSPQ